MSVRASPACAAPIGQTAIRPGLFGGGLFGGIAAGFLDAVLFGLLFGHGLFGGMVASTKRPPAGARPAAGLSLDRIGNGRPSPPRDLAKRSGRLWVVPFLKQKYRQAKLAGVKVGWSSIASPTNTSACTLPPRGRESCRTAFDSFHQSARAAGSRFHPQAGAACQEKTHMKNMTANAATASVIAMAATIRKSSSIGGLPAAMSVRRIQS